jgi:AraC family transcriptional regulator
LIERKGAFGTNVPLNFGAAERMGSANGEAPMAHGRAMRGAAGGGLAPWQVELTRRLLLRDLCSDCPVERLAHLCGLSRSYFTRAFKASMGAPPHRWLVRARLRRAGELLERTDQSISLIALACGFADQSHLTRMFHASVGVSPAAWRRQRRAGIAPPIATLS